MYWPSDQQQMAAWVPAAGVPPPRRPPGPLPTMSPEFTRESINTYNPTNIARLFTKAKLPVPNTKAVFVAERPSRRWMVSIPQWLECLAMPQGARFEEDAPTAKRTYREIADESQERCAMSGERFETYYDEDAYEWFYRDTVRIKRRFGDVCAGRLVLAAALREEDLEANDRL